MQVLFWAHEDRVTYCWFFGIIINQFGKENYKKESASKKPSENKRRIEIRLVILKWKTQRRKTIFIYIYIYIYLSKTTFSSLHFHAISTLVSIFYFHYFYSLSWKKRLVFVPSITSEMENAHVANGVHYWHTKSWRSHWNNNKKMLFGIKKCHISI